MRTAATLTSHADPILVAVATWALRLAAAAYGGFGQQKAPFSRMKLCLVTRITCRPVLTSIILQASL